MSSYFRLIQRGFGSQGSCIEINFNHEYIFLINSPEMIQRSIMETKTKLSKLKGILYTQITGKTFLGYPDIIMTVADIGEGTPKHLLFMGPPPLHKGILSFVTTLYRPDINCFNIIQLSKNYDNSVKENIINLLEDEHKLHFPHCFPCIELPNGFKIRPIYISCDYNNNTNHNDNTNYNFCDKYREFLVCHAFDIKRFSSSNNDIASSSDIISYAIYSPSVPGNLDVKKAKELGVPIGPLLGKLSKGESIITPSGNTVHPKDCISPEKPGGISLIIYCPEEEYLNNLSLNICLNNILNDSNNNILCICHISPLSIILNDNYINIFKNIKQNNSIIHMFVISNEKYYSPIYIASNELQKKLQTVLNNYSIPNLEETSDININGIISENKNINNMLLKNYNKLSYCGDIMSTIQFHPPKKILYNNSLYNDFIKSFIKLKTTNNTYNEKSNNDNITFLGTAASVVSRYRGVSSLLLETKKGYMLIDTGSGTYSQLVRLYGINKTNNILKSLKCIWISHKHADHCQGIIQILLQLQNIYNIKSDISPQTYNKLEYTCEQCKLSVTSDTSSKMHNFIHHNKHFRWGYTPSECGETLQSDSIKLDNNDNDNEPILIIGPMWIQQIINDYLNIENIIFYKFIDAQDLTTNTHPMNNYFKKHLGINNIQSIPMHHSYPTYGLIITTDNWKLSYSADSRPFEPFIEAAKHSTILIHECTFDDEVLERAKNTSHSTVSEALLVGKEALVQCIILFHFSTRFSRASFPLLNDEYFNNNPQFKYIQDKIIPAFDFLKIPLDNINEIKRLCDMLPELLKLKLT